jgi:hypothetical protein
VANFDSEWMAYVTMSFESVSNLGGCSFRSWGRGHPEQYTDVVPLGEEYDADAEKRRSAGQILWIRGLTRLQTQVGVLNVVI